MIYKLKKLNKSELRASGSYSKVPSIGYYMVFQFIEILKTHWLTAREIFSMYYSLVTLSLLKIAATEAV